MSINTWSTRCAAHVVGVMAIAAAPAPAQSLAYFGGVQYAAGDFIFAQRTWSAYLVNGLSWSEGRVRLSASVPLVLQPAGWPQYSGTGMMVPSGGMAGATATPHGSAATEGMNSGTMMSSSGMLFNGLRIGDPVGRIDVTLSQPATTRGALRVVGAVKAPLAAAGRGVGTGEWDAGAGLSSVMNFDRTSVFAEAVYWRLGNPPGGSLRNAVSYALSIGRAFPRSHWSLLGTVAGASSLWRGTVAPAQAGMGVGYLLASGSSVFATAAAGLTRTAPTISTGVGWRIPLGTGR